MTWGRIALASACLFDILGISLDRDTDRAKLEGVIKDKGMTWRQVYDGKDWQAEIAQVYDVQSIPFTILLGKDGKVAGTNLRGAKLEEAVVNDQEPSKEIAVAMCTADEPGEKLQVYGRVLDEHGKPLQKASVIAYSTDMTGLYVPRGSRSRTPRISAVAVTNDG